MNWKRIWLTALLVFIAYEIISYLVHSVILMGIYSSPELQQVFRPGEAMNRFMWVMFVTAAVYSFFFAYIFAKGYEGKGILEGIRFGIVIGLFSYFVGMFDQFVIFPIPYSLTWYWIIFGMIQTIIMGIVAALIYRPAKSQAAAAA